MLEASVVRSLSALCMVALATTSCARPTEPTQVGHCLDTLDLECSPLTTGLRCRAVDHCLSPSDITSNPRTEWRSSDLNVVTVSNGFVQSVGRGDAAVTARYTSSNGASIAGERRVRVLTGQPPRMVAEYSASVLRGPACRGFGDNVAGATVDIIDGLNAGRRAVSDARGSFSFPDIVIDPTQIVRGGKEGYTSVTVHALPDGGMPDVCIAPIQ